MTAALPAGPWETLSIAGQQVAYYVLPFDKLGVLQAPRTAEHMRSAAADGVTDVFVLAHGWNNDWSGAVDFYRRFMSTYGDVILGHGRPRPDYKPLLAGVFWPSIVLPDSTAPAMAATPTDDLDVQGLEALADETVADADRAEMYALVQRPRLDQDGARRLAELLAPLYARRDDDLPLPESARVEDIVRLWTEIDSALAAQDDDLVVSGSGGRPDPVEAGGPVAAGALDVLDPRNVIRTATVLLMKDRAGVVGSRGVAPLLEATLRAAPNARVHLVGHSYGCKVALSAVCARPLPRDVRSILLMQPALSYLALAEELPKVGGPGGYHAARARCALPILVTWTHRDTPLRTLFQLAVRRPDDLGEQNIGAAGLETPPSRFAAMGGWGPEAGAGVRNEGIRRPNDGRYALGDGTEVLALEAHQVITGHSDVVQAATAWALYNLVAAG